MQPELLKKLVLCKLPNDKYQGRLSETLSTHSLGCVAHKGFATGERGQVLESTQELHHNNLTGVGAKTTPKNESLCERHPCRKWNSSARGEGAAPAGHPVSFHVNETAGALAARGQTNMMIGMTKSVLVTALAALLLQAAHADTVYRCVDGKGKTTYSDDACDKMPAGGKQQKVLTLVHPPVVARKPVAPQTPVRQKKLPVKEAVFRLFYNTQDAPIEIADLKVEALIRQAARAWSKNCKVNIQYGGKTDYKGKSSAERVVVRWSPDQFTASHPAMEGIRPAGLGGPQHGISLLPRVSDEHLLHVLVHELGHVLGLRHRHTDLTSVMSYLASPSLTEPSAGDYAACNLAMQRQFGIPLELPVANAADPDARMSDGEALRLRYDPNPMPRQ